MSLLLKLSIRLFLPAVVFTGCSLSKTFSDNFGKIDFETVKEISIVFKDSTQQTIKWITGKEAIKEFVNDLNTSPGAGPWKGAKWDNILLVCADTTIRLNTNGSVFGTSTSGQFFNLNKKYQQPWKQSSSKN